MADRLWLAVGGGGGGCETASPGRPPSYQANISEWKASATESAGSWKLELCEPGWLGEAAPDPTGGVALRNTRTHGLNTRPTEHTADAAVGGVELFCQTSANRIGRREAAQWGMMI